MLQALPVGEGLATNTVLRAHLAETYRKTGFPQDGLATVDVALRETERGGERVVEAELHRVKGELLLMVDSTDEVEAERCFRGAIGIARRQDARLFELRATTNLARLLKRQGERDEARAMLAQIYNWFTEGFDTADLKDAKALLDELDE